MKRTMLAALVALTFAAQSHADIMPVSMSFYGQVGQTAVFRGFVDANTLTTIGRVIIADANTGGGSSGIFSGADLDFVVLDRDGDFLTTGDQFKPLATTATYVDLGWKKKPTTSIYQPTALHPGELFGLKADGSIDFTTATLGTRDAAYVGGVSFAADTSSGWVSVGFDGQLSAGFSNIAIRPSGVYVFVGDAGANDEYLDSTVNVEVPSVVIPVQMTDPGPYAIPPGGVFVLGGGLVEPNVVAWDWDLDHDGQYDDATGDSLAFSYEYFVNDLGLPASDILVGLRTTDSDTSQHFYEATLALPEPGSLLLVAAGGLTQLIRGRRRGR